MLQGARRPACCHQLLGGAHDPGEKLGGRGGEGPSRFLCRMSAEGVAGCSVVSRVSAWAGSQGGLSGHSAGAAPAWLSLTVAVAGGALGAGGAGCWGVLSCPQAAPFSSCPLLRSQGVIEFSLCLLFAKLVSYTFLYWLPLYIFNVGTFWGEAARKGSLVQEQTVA